MAWVGRLWDVASHKEIATLAGHTGVVVGRRSVRMAGTLAATSHDGTTRLWDPDPARVTARNCQLIGTVTQDRWEQLMPELPYRPTCS
jgi:WD40 repeat protein